METDKPLMRVNLATAAPGGRDDVLSRFLGALAREFALEYALEDRASWLYMFSPEQPTREIFADTLARKGWRISAYTLPPAPDGRSYSWGYAFEEDCDRLIQWKLSNL